MRYRHLFLGLLTANTAALIAFSGCDLKSGGTGGVDPVPGEDSGFDAGIDTGPGGECPGKDLQGDPLNCGACNHSCLGGACQDAGCAPTRFSQFDNPGDFAIDDAGIVVTSSKNPGPVLYVPLDGDGGVTTLVASEGLPNGPSTDGTIMCWSADNNHVACSSKAGGPILDGQQTDLGPKSTLIEGSNVYWVVYGTTALNTALPDGGAKRTVAVGESVNAPVDSRSLVFDPSRSLLLWVVPGSRTLYAAPLDQDGGAAIKLARVPLGVPYAVAVGPDGYYIAAQNADGNMGGIFRASKDADGGTAEMLIQQSLLVPSIAVDGQTVYYSDKGGGNVYRFTIGSSIPDGGLAAFASGQSFPVGVRPGHDGFIYWANDVADGGLMRVAK